MRVFRDECGDTLEISLSKGCVVLAAEGFGMQSITLEFSEDTATLVRDYLIELLPLDGNTASQPQLEQVGDMGVLVDTRPLPMTINVTGNVYINQVDKGE